MGSYESGGYSLGGNGYVDPSDAGNKDLKQMQDWFYNANYPSSSVGWVQGSIDKNFKVGNQFLNNALYGNKSQNVTRFFFNLIRRTENMICGFQRKNRKSIVTIPFSDNDDPLADDYNKCLRWCDDRDGFQEYLCQAFEGACDTGENVVAPLP